VRAGEQAFQEGLFWEDHEKAWTEDEIIEFIGEELSELAALLEHPEFERGVCQGQEYFFNSYEEAPLTEEEMTDEVEGNVSRRATKQDRKKPSSSLHRLGWVVGTIAKGLSYAY
jgi:hypothetical protein